MVIRTGKKYNLTGYVFDVVGNCYKVSKLTCEFCCLDYESSHPERTDMVFKTIEDAQKLATDTHLFISFQQDCKIEKIEKIDC